MEEKKGDSTDQIDFDALQELGRLFYEAADAGDMKTVESIYNSIGNIIFELAVGEKGESSLHISSKNGHLPLTLFLLEAGHAWNAVDNDYHTAAEYAYDNGFHEIYNEILNHACRCELLLGVIERSNRNLESKPNSEYLNMKLKYDDKETKLVDEENNGVMMNWEAPLMNYHADVICPEEGLSILNVGFGLGIIDMEIQKRKPRKHTIIEAHPDVYKHMIETGWDKKENVQIIFGRWQDVLDQLEVYDGIFFDTFGEFYEDQREFHEVVPNILSETGVYSFFNGLGGTNPFFHHVYREIASMELQEMGLSTEYTEIDFDANDDPEWEGIKRKYWSLKKYYLPTCRFSY